MKLFKSVVLLVAVLFVAVPAWAGNIPEFDAVGCDANNVFASINGQYGVVIDNNIGTLGPINYFSYFSSEYFNQTAGQLKPDPCYGEFGLMSALTDVYNEGVYNWRIVLQMKPESDIDLNIYDCVLKHNEIDIWGNAEQTGRYRADWGQLFFIPTANPLVTVTASPGPYATPGFISSFIMDARLMPGLGLVSMQQQPYTSKAHWSEGLVLALPATGMTNVAGQTTYNLKQGDMITVKVEIPGNNTADVRYGADSVILKYIGIVYTDYNGSQCASDG